MTGIDPAELDETADHLEPQRRSVGALEVAAWCGAAQPHGRAAEPARPGLGLLRGRREHGDEPVLGTRRPGAVMPGVAEEGSLADLGPCDAHPAAAQLVARDEGVVGEEGAVGDVVIFGSRRTVEASTPLPTRAPRARSHAGVSRLA